MTAACTLSLVAADSQWCCDNSDPDKVSNCPDEAKRVDCSGAPRPGKTPALLVSLRFQERTSINPRPFLEAVGRHRTNAGL